MDLKLGEATVNQNPETGNIIIRFSVSAKLAFFTVTSKTIVVNFNPKNMHVNVRFV